MADSPAKKIRDQIATATETGSKYALDVTIIDGSGTPITSFGGAGGTSATDEAAYTPTVTTGTPIMGAVDDVASDAAAEGKVGIVRMTPARSLNINIAESGVSIGGGTEYTEGDTDTTFTGGIVLTEGPSNTATPIQSNAAKDVLVAVNAAIPAGSNAIGKLAANSGVDIGDVDILSIAAGNNNIGDVDVASIAAGDNNIGNVDVVTLPALPSGSNVIGHVIVDTTSTTAVTQATAANLNATVVAAGDVAHDGVDAGNPLKIGAKALTAPPTAVAANDRVNLQANIYGELIVRHALRETKGNQQTTITTSTSETTVVTADATYKLDLYGLILTNTSVTGTSVTIKDSTAGTTRIIVYVPPGETRGFMLAASDGHIQAAANNNWTATSSASITSLHVTALFVKNL